QPGVTVIDVRTPAEFADGHLPGAVNINVEDPTFPDAIAALDATADYAVYCRSGNRSRVAMDYMTQAGVTRTVGLEGGITAWTGTVER
ncbi:MAG: rhodanese-like domain-containing protein, partial [Actinobacteria bacterium HGW-Actinobacteria-8]